MSLVEYIVPVIAVAPPLIVAVVLHEVAHGYAAEKLGDPTARALGRITLNPLRHIDPVLTILLPAILIFSHSPVIFGGAKPVPVNPLFFKNPRRGMAIVAIAGPLINFFLAALSWAVFSVYAHLNVESIPLPQSAALVVGGWLFQSILINLVLGTFNLIPVPPLDGGRIAVGFLPLPLAQRYARLERWGLLLVFLLLWSGWFQKILGPIMELCVKTILGDMAAS